MRCGRLFDKISAAAFFLSCRFPSENGRFPAAENLPRVKEKFYKTDNTVAGSGIGLAVADEIVKLHGGTLNIDSILNEGTTVTITLPIEAVSYTDEKEVQDEEEKNSN